jgi:hypothetical protein
MNIKSNISDLITAIGDNYVLLTGDFKDTEFTWSDFEFGEDDSLSYSYNMKKFCYSGALTDDTEIKLALEQALEEIILMLLNQMIENSKES